MSTDRPDPGEFIERAQQMLRELFGGASAAGPWGAAPGAGQPAAPRGAREPSPAEQRENLTFALATRAVEAIEDLALNVAAIRQRLERLDGRAAAPAEGGERPRGGAEGPDGEPGTPPA
ncbi:hypothetical protein [Trujillonella endophytica]|uniref:Uncharacterized protein n=1 Tax=Trujillonella endophytica TaxID=673521 RepID=A0A1H8T053_9ACTN|nr:hypothetical protein [Trujillella endophytica]SEO83988.1 hypothetical protein SAMN05660991_01943 [Trujillella endophytica]